MYTDINDLATELFGRKTVTDNLGKNGGAGVWDLYFDVVASHARHYRTFQKSFFISYDTTLYFLNDLFLIPGCKAETERKVMSREKAEYIISLIGKPLTGHEYRKTVMYLCEFRIPDEQLQVLLNKQLENRKRECEGNSLFAGKTLCRQRLAKMFPMWSDVIFDNTAQAMNVFNYITCAKTGMNRLFLNSLDNDFKKELTIPGSILWASWTRNYVVDDTDSKFDKRICDEFSKRFEDTYLSDHTLPGDNSDFWKGQAEFEPDDALNSVLFARQLPFTSMRKDKEHLMHLESLFSKTEKLHELYQNHKEKVVMAYMYDKLQLDHILLKRMADSKCNSITLSRSEFLLLFLNRFPTFEDNRKLMSEETMQGLQKYIISESTEIRFVDLLWLLQLTYKERVDEETLVSWTEKYFETELMKMS